MELDYTYSRTGANQGRNIGVLSSTRHTTKVFEPDIRDGEVAWILVAEGGVVLAIALGQLDGPFDVVHVHGVVGHVVDAAGSAAALEVGREFGGDAGQTLMRAPSCVVCVS